jgi:hypothetical protein
MTWPSAQLLFQASMEDVEELKQPAGTPEYAMAARKRLG